MKFPINSSESREMTAKISKICLKERERQEETEM